MQLGELDDLYQEIILDHYRNPRNRGLLESADLSGKGFNPFCGDQVDLTVALDGDGHIHHTGLAGQGCVISQASASIMGELLKGKTLQQAVELAELFKGVMQGQALTGEQEERFGELTALGGVKQYPIRIKCALLAWSTLEDAIAEYRKGHPD